MQFGLAPCGWCLGAGIPRALSLPPSARVRVAHRVEATELVAGHGDHHREHVPAHTWISKQLEHRHKAQVPLYAALGLYLSHLPRHIFFPQERLEGCRQDGQGPEMGLSVRKSWPSMHSYILDVPVLSSISAFLYYFSLLFFRHYFSLLNYSLQYCY